MTLPLAPRGYSGFGGSVAGTTSGATLTVAEFFAEIVDTLGELKEEIDKIEFTNSSSSAGADGRAGAEFYPGDIVTTGDYELTLLHDPQKVPPFGSPETIKITLPKRGSATVAATKTFTGFLKSHIVSMPFKDKMITKVMLTVSGRVAHVAAT